VDLGHDSHVDRRGSTEGRRGNFCAETARCEDAGPSILTCLDMPKRNAHMSKAGVVPEVHFVIKKLVLTKSKQCGTVSFPVELMDASVTLYVPIRRRLRNHG
jgi:hypothetical protein